MTSKFRAFAFAATLVAATGILTWINTGGAQQSSVSIGNTDIGGVVTGPNGPEAGVWVIAESRELPTRFIRIVVTDDQGRYVIPDLPNANYDVWVRGYGLVDSQKIKSAPGKIVDHKAVPAPNAAAAAHYYPAIYWFSMLKLPAKSEFPGKGGESGLAETAKSFAAWVDSTKSNGCVGCHQIGNEATRTIPKELGKFDNAFEAWSRRIQSGQASESMTTQISRMDGVRALKDFGEWTDRIAEGQLPKAKPERPQGVERNVVVTLWDWGTGHTYLHDEISTDKRNPTVNAYGKLYGATEFSTDNAIILDPKTNTASEKKIPVRDPKTPDGRDAPMMASPYWGEEPIWSSQSNAHNPMIDDKGRVWFTSRVRPSATPEFCQNGDLHPSAKVTPIKSSGRQVSFYDPKTDKFTLINTCFGTHHLIFAEDANNTLWTSGGGPVVGWINTNMFDETGDEVKSQGWTALVMDTNGNGKRDEAVAANAPVDPTKDKVVPGGGFYGIAYSPVDGSIWGSTRNFPGGVIRLVPGPNPSETALAEYYEVPWKDETAANYGYGPRGMDIDRNGVVWVPLSSGHLASFDRSKCKGPLNGPTATGQHCPEGWTMYPFPGPQFEGVSDSGSAESAYYTWVDQRNTLGLGDNVPMATGNENESIIALKDGKMVNMRIPYPMGFYAKGIDGRIDDPNAGWKGRGIWSTTGTRAPFHMEGGKENKPKVVHIQLRPDPLAR
ncbi:MAG: carboxypeptidase regulatory-like domain-containing protein [Gemmatimonas sp.]